ncbi:MAG: DUF2244 domain-containing protein [Betaproteobacteria bacterium]
MHSISIQATYCVTLRRNDSLGARGRLRVFAALAALSLALGLAFAALGAWLILPYSVLEIAALFAAFCWIARHADDSESLSIDADRVVVERRCAGVTTSTELNRHWTRLDVASGAGVASGTLALCASGKRVPIGVNLSAQERARVAATLRRALASR